MNKYILYYGYGYDDVSEIHEDYNWLMNRVEHYSKLGYNLRVYEFNYVGPGWLNGGADYELGEKIEI